MSKKIYIAIVVIAILILINKFIEVYRLSKVWYSLSYIICGTAPLVVYLFVKKEKQ